VIPRLRPGVSIKKVMITVFPAARQLISLDALPKGQKSNQEHFVQNNIPPLLNEKKRFSRQKQRLILLRRYVLCFVTMAIKLSMNYIA
jgi:hypothetical protein